MKSILTFSFFTFFILCSWGQNCRVNIPVSSVVVGKNLIKKNEIEAVSYLFPEKIINCTTDKTTQRLMIEICDNYESNNMIARIGRTIMIDRDRKIPMWDKKLDYLSERCELINDRMIIYGFRNVFEIYDSNSAKLVFKSKQKVYGFLPKFNLLLAKYEDELSSTSTRYIQALSLENGKEKWRKKISYKMTACNQIQMVNDSTFSFESDGWEFCNISNGSGMTLRLETAKPNYTNAAIATVGLAAGLLTGTFFYPVGGSSQIDGISSNLLSDSLNYYLAGKTELKSVDLKGNIRWGFELDKSKSSKSDLINLDSLILMINRGYANYANNPTLCGKAFVTLYRKKDGKELAKIEFDDKKYITDTHLKGDTLSVLIENKIINLNLHSLTKISEYDILLDKKESAREFTNPYNYGIIKNNKLEAISGYCSERQFVSTSKGKVIELSKTGKTENLLLKSDFYTFYKTIGSHKIYLKNEQGFIVDRNDQCIAFFETGESNIVVGNRIFSFSKNRLLDIDLTDVLEK
ncbi:MAG: hypothetical protein ACOYOT_09185 [Bacteroidales bacterium]